MVIAFWNLDKNEREKVPIDFSDILLDFVTEYGIDIFFLAEVNSSTIANFLAKNRYRQNTRHFTQVINAKARTTLLTSYSPKLFSDKSGLYPSHRWDAFLLQIPGIITLNLISVHFHSKVNWSEYSLALECANFARDIITIEKNTGCNETILIGDFNMNPFEAGMVAANGLHAIQDLEYSFSMKNGRNIDGTDYQYFYNPMWNFFGDFQRPLGTHYNRTSGHVSQEWNTYDQAILRPSLKPRLGKDFIRIIDKIGGNLITSDYFGRPNDRDYSDHLPIVLELKT